MSKKQPEKKDGKRINISYSLDDGLRIDVNEVDTADLTLALCAIVGQITEDIADNIHSGKTEKENKIRKAAIVDAVLKHVEGFARFQANGGKKRPYIPFVARRGALLALRDVLALRVREMAGKCASDTAATEEQK